MRTIPSLSHYDDMTARCAAMINTAKHTQVLSRYKQAMGLPSACLRMTGLSPNPPLRVIPLSFCYADKPAVRTCGLRDRFAVIQPNLCRSQTCLQVLTRGRCTVQLSLNAASNADWHFPANYDFGVFCQ